MSLGPPRNVLLTGYWPPTNEMLLEFSTEHNTDGWQGKNWRGYGFDIYAYFPQFKTEEPPYGPGFGDLRVDYQDTSRDWWSITDRLRPIAIITFSRTDEGHDWWELEAVTVNRDSWVDDYEEPKQPTPSPPDDSVPAGYERESTLPMDAIVDRLRNSDIDVSAFRDTRRGAGGFLSEYIGYHGQWYEALHRECNLHTRCIAAGHIHVGGGLERDLDTARRAMRMTLETVLEHVHDHIADCLSVRDVALTCGGQTPPLSVLDDLFGGDVRDTRRLKPRLVDLLSDCR